ncbi:MAG: tRNA threonylcarbamoyladenosine biosynthesis protein TsaB [Acidimicrobiaceae bacterium]|jgi:tRNA threonylcarbamoyladenosine biosynthesis protein TsaB|nr:tRNA threonylcarbamoyladenosine biosynthesis protein TsaB [Acidimicrobiaceae bacterium]
MLILGIESATARIGCAIGGHEGVLAQFEMTRGRRHCETLVPAIRFTCEQADIALDEISVVAVDVGPGLFTGLRVGLATAKALAHALRVPVIGIASLDLVAFPVRYTSRVIVTVLDARRGELYYAYYRQSPGGVQRVSDYLLGTPDDIVSELLAVSHQDLLLIGDGALRYRDRFSDIRNAEFAEQWLAYPSAAPLVQLAHARALREDWVNPWDLAPLYLRKPDADINWSIRDSH